MPQSYRVDAHCTMAMASAIPVEDSPITSVKIKTRLADGWIHYQELVGLNQSSIQASSTEQSELGIADHIRCLDGSQISVVRKCL